MTANAAWSRSGIAAGLLSLVLATPAHAQSLQSSSQDAMSSTVSRGQETVSSTAPRRTGARDLNVGSSTATGAERRAGPGGVRSGGNRQPVPRSGYGSNETIYGTGSVDAGPGPFGSSGYGPGQGGAAGPQFPSELGYGGGRSSQGGFSGELGNGYGGVVGSGGSLNGTAAGPQYSTQLQGGENRFRR